MNMSTLLPASTRQLPGSADPSLPLLEFELPTAALMATPVKPAARSMLWTVVSLVAACATAAAVVPVDMVGHHRRPGCRDAADRGGSAAGDGDRTRDQRPRGPSRSRRPSAGAVGPDILCRRCWRA